MDSTTGKKVSLPEAGKSCRVQQTHSHWAVLCVSLIILSAVFAAAFVGGYYLGKDRGKTEDKTSTAPTTQQSVQHRAFTVQYDGNTRVIPAFLGSLPVQEFIQPRAVLIDGKLVSMPGNPLLTPKGTSQLFIYQYGEEVSIIVTATGQNYGEEVENASLVGEGHYTLTTTGLAGKLVQMTDGYHQLHNRIPIPNTLSMKLNWGNVGSHGFTFVLNDPSSVNATVYFSALSGTDQPLNIRGCHEYDTELSELPNPDFPLTITPYKGKFSLQNRPEAQSETPIPLFSSSQSPNLRLVRLNSMGGRRRRSMATRVPSGMAFIISHPDTKEVLHRIELRHENRHGGKKGSVCWNVQNHVHGMEVSLCPLFHRALYNGLQNNESDDGSTTMLLNTHLRQISNDSDSMTSWRHMAALVHGVDPDDVIQNLMGGDRRSRRNILTCLWHLGEDLVSLVEHGPSEEWEQFKAKVEATVSVVRKAWNYLTGNGTPPSWRCGLGQSYNEIDSCISNVKKCTMDVAEDGLTLGLGLACTVDDCSSAVNACASIAQDCVGQ